MTMGPGSDDEDGMNISALGTTQILLSVTELRIFAQENKTGLLHSWEGRTFLLAAAVRGGD